MCTRTNPPFSVEVTKAFFAFFVPVSYNAPNLTSNIQVRNDERTRFRNVPFRGLLSARADLATLVAVDFGAFAVAESKNRVSKTPPDWRAALL